ncbi:endonuclease/exonuclease/phosphatase family protein [Pseudomonas farsensis]|uniref:Endonuclease/exonuclease/phosphatase family protein n=1 Tax=Pseudomonas farsensis TaxID=2745492 RepID=A0ABU8QMB3_9PSED
MKETLMLASALLLALQQTPAMADSCGVQLNIGSWNIEWLGSPVRNKIGKQTPADIASYIEASNVDVLGLQEISANRRMDGKANNLQLDKAFALLNGRGADWQYRLFKKHPQASSPNAQWTGLAWDNNKVQITGGPWNVAGVDEQRRAELLGADSRKVALNRTPYAVKLSAGEGRSDFLFVPLHLKANNGKGASEAQRELEVHLILKGLEPVIAHEGEKDLIMMGDTNMLSTGEPGIKLLQAYGMKDCNSSDVGTWLTTEERFSDAPFDRFFVMRDQPETQSTCNADSQGSMAFNVMTPGDWEPGMDAKTFRERLSDHQMIRTSLCIGADDD